MFLRKTYLAIFIALIPALCCNTKQAEATRSSDELRSRIAALIASQDGKVGVAVIHPEKNDTFSVNNLHRYPMQSVYKFPLALAVLNEVDKGKLSLQQKVELSKKDAQQETWSPLSDKYPEGNVEISVGELLYYSVSMSDNVACDLLFRLLGGPATVDRYVHGLGIKDIAIRSTEEEMHRKQKLQYDNYCYPMSMSELLKGFHKGSYLSDSSQSLLLRLMTESSNSSRIKGLLGPDVNVAHKTGTSGVDKKGLRGAINDAGIITLPDGNHIALTVFVSDSKASYEQQEKLIALIGKAVYEYYSGRTHIYFEKGKYPSGTDTLPYRLLSPASEDPSRKYPLLVFLHGAGLRGSDNEKQISKLNTAFTDSANRLKYPCYILVPHCPEKNAWAKFPGYPNSLAGTKEPSMPAKLALALIHDLLKTRNIDESRIYLTGFSLGAEGTLDLAMREPGLFACAVPVSGLGDTARARLIKDIPLWAFHGDNDQVIEVKYSRIMVDAIKRNGGNAKLTEFPGLPHNIQNEVYAKDELWRWMFEQKR